MPPAQGMSPALGPPRVGRVGGCPPALAAPPQAAGVGRPARAGLRYVVADFAFEVAILPSHFLF
jgi:hypothetical protein